MGGYDPQKKRGIILSNYIGEISELSPLRHFAQFKRSFWEYKRLEGGDGW